MPFHHLGFLCLRNPILLKRGIIFLSFISQCLELRIKYVRKKQTGFELLVMCLKIALIGQPIKRNLSKVSAMG